MMPLHTSRVPVAILAMLACVAIPVVACAADSRFSLSLGTEYSTGDYGGDKSVDEIYVPVTGTLDVDRVSFRLTVPFLSVRAPEGTVIEGPDGQPVVGEGPKTTESGIGDVLASVTVFDVLTADSGDVALDLTGKVKFGTADADKGLGTGEQDYSVQADLFRFFDRFTVLGSVGYAFRGDPDVVDLEDTFFASVGGTYSVTSQTRCGVFYDFREASLPGSDSLQELTGLVSTRLSGDWRLHGYLIAGFGDNSPDWGAGLSIATTF